MTRLKRGWIGIVALVMLALALAACGGDDEDDNADSAPAESTATEVSAGELNLNVGPGLDTGANLNPGTDSGTLLPGCSDPDSDECPAPLQMQLDGTISDGGITINYPARYFTALAGDENPEGVPIQIQPNDTYAFEQEAVFQVYFEPSVEDAVSSLEEPVSAPWTAQQIGDGTIAVQKVEDQDPPVNTIVGAFPVDDERVVVLKLSVTGQYGWDLFSRVYEAMLNTLAVAPAEPATTG